MHTANHSAAVAEAVLGSHCFRKQRTAQHRRQRRDNAAAPDCIGGSA